MNRKYVLVVITLGLLFLIIISILRVDVLNLGDGYLYRDEGEWKDILCEDPNGGEIPATIICFDYDKNFIVAKQIPRVPQELLYSKEYTYKAGDKEFYYWLIIKKRKLVIGPMDSVEFEATKTKYNVSDNLNLK